MHRGGGEPGHQGIQIGTIRKRFGDWPRFRRHFSDLVSNRIVWKPGVSKLTISLHMPEAYREARVSMESILRARGCVSTASRPEPLGHCDPHAAARSNHENHVLHRLQRSRSSSSGPDERAWWRSRKGGIPGAVTVSRCRCSCPRQRENTMKMW